MSTNITIRTTEADDIPSLKMLYQEAFDDEDLFPLVTELFDNAQNTLHLTAVLNNKAVGHITFTQCHASPENLPLSLLGPMAVLPEYQKQGIGRKLIAAGFEQLKAQGVFKVLVLGDPDFYSRCGFIEEQHVTTPYSIPEDWKPAWQSIALSATTDNPSGLLHVPDVWQKQKLWFE